MGRDEVRAIEEQLEAREAVLERVRLLLIRELKVQREPDELDPDTPLFGTGLRLDSADAVELVAAVVEAFGLELLERSRGPAALRTINTLVDLVLEHGGHDLAR